MENVKIAEMLLDHEERIKWLEENMFTRKDRNRLFETLDKHSAILERLDQEQASTGVAIKRIQDDVENLKEDMGRVKEVLKIS